MRAMVLNEPGTPLANCERPVPEPGPGQVLLEVHACAVCRTDLHLVDGELPDIPVPIVPGHEIVGTVAAAGADTAWTEGQRLGVPWLAYSCGTCSYCRAGRENLCDSARFTGYQVDGGYAEYTLADHRYCFPIDPSYGDAEAAPLLCAGLIGYRALRMTGDARRIGIYGFGAAGHLVTQVADYQGRDVFAFVRPGDKKARVFANDTGATWAGYSNEAPPEALDAAIIFAPVGALVPQALTAVRKGGVVVCGGIHMSDIPSFPYGYLWEERKLCSVANLTRRDATEFLAIAPKVPVRTAITTFPLEDANKALDALRAGKLSGAAVLLTGK